MAAAERAEAARRAEAAAAAEGGPARGEREIAEAHASAQRQAAVCRFRDASKTTDEPRGWAEADLRQMSDPACTCISGRYSAVTASTTPMPIDRSKNGLCSNPGFTRGCPWLVSTTTVCLVASRELSTMAKSEYMSIASVSPCAGLRAIAFPTTHRVCQIYRGPARAASSGWIGFCLRAHPGACTQPAGVPIPVAPMTPVDSQRIAAAAPGNASQPGQSMMGVGNGARSSAPTAANRDSSTSSGCCGRKSRGACFDAVSLVR